MLKRIWCLIVGHDWVWVHRTRIDLQGDEDGAKICLCWRCKQPWDEPQNIQTWNECIHLPGTVANLRIREIGLEAYRLERAAEGDRQYGIR